jgi:uncharacterized YigZ family protein
MILEYKIVYEGGCGETIEKKSQFIATVFPVESEETIITFIEQTRKKYWDATHNCYAYVLGANNEVQRCVDDGEPSGTAGKPILDVLLGEGIHDALIIVTRYFGGTLLGTGGLVRAYSKAAQDGLKNSVIVQKCLGKKIRIETDYNGIGKLQYIIGQMSLVTMDTVYTDNVNAYVLATLDQVAEFTKKVIEATAGRAGIEVIDEIYYAQKGNDVILFKQ